MYYQLIKTIIGKYCGIDKLNTPTILHLTLTNRCNSRCVMCNIWSGKNKQDISPDILMKYKTSTLGKNLRILDLTGGEPFLCDVPSVIKSLDNGKIKTILISTNGFLTEKIAHDIRNVLDAMKANIVIDISVDGIGDKHDKIRGVTGAYEKAIGTLQKLHSFNEKRLRISLKMTILKENFDQIMACYQKAEDLDVDFTCKPGTNFGFLDNEEMSFELQKSDYESIIGDLEKISTLRKVNTHYNGLSLWDRFFIVSNMLFSDKLIEYYKLMAAGNTRMITPCYSSFLSVMLHHDNTVYSCPTLMKRLGAVHHTSFESVWSSEKAKEVRKFINDRQCACFSQCDQMPALVLGNTPQVLLGVLSSYFK